MRRHRHRHRHPHRRFLGRLEDVAAVHGGVAGRPRGLGAERRDLSADGRVGRDLGPGLCLDQFDAAGAAGRRRAGSASASVSLNTSALYIGQAVGSAIGGFLYARDLFYAAGYVATAFVALAVIAVILTKPGKGRDVSAGHLRRRCGRRLPARGRPAGDPGQRGRCRHPDQHVLDRMFGPGLSDVIAVGDAIRRLHEHHAAGP